MNCPHCSAELRTLVYEGVEIQTCDGCGGEFVGGSELAHIVNAREARFDPELVELLSAHEPVLGTQVEGEGHGLHCPACAASMTTFNYAVDTGVHVDRCRVCNGVWLDCEELERVQIIMQRWEDVGPERIREVAAELEQARQIAETQTTGAFKGSRFGFVNALINRLLDAA